MRVPLIVLAIGLVLMTLQIRFESEPGALPLFLVLVGTGWTLFGWSRRRSSRAGSGPIQLIAPASAATFILEIDHER